MDKISWIFADVAQVLFLGGIFRQFVHGTNTVDQGGGRRMAAVQLAIDRVNDKYDDNYDNLLPSTKVGVR